MALDLQALVQEGLQVAPPLPLFTQLGPLLSQLGLSPNQLIPNLPMAGMSMCRLITLQPTQENKSQHCSAPYKWKMLTVQ